MEDSSPATTSSLLLPTAARALSLKASWAHKWFLGLMFPFGGSREVLNRAENNQGGCVCQTRSWAISFCPFAPTQPSFHNPCTWKNLTMGGLLQSWAQSGLTSLGETSGISLLSLKQS